MIERFIQDSFAEKYSEWTPWELIANRESVIADAIDSLPDEYSINDGIAIHDSAVIESKATLKPPLVIHRNCFVADNAYLRGGVILFENVTIGPSVEIKSSFIFSKSSVAHFNFIGDSVLGAGVNIEAGAILANYHNDRSDKTIRVRRGKELVALEVEKFGSLVGDGVCIGANAVLSPGTVLYPGTVVPRLSLIDQERAAT